MRAEHTLYKQRNGDCITKYSEVREIYKVLQEQTLVNNDHYKKWNWSILFLFIIAIRRFVLIEYEIKKWKTSVSVLFLFNMHSVQSLASIHSINANFKPVHRNVREMHKYYGAGRDVHGNGDTTIFVLREGTAAKWFPFHLWIVLIIGGWVNANCVLYFATLEKKFEDLSTLKVCSTLTYIFKLCTLQDCCNSRSVPGSRNGKKVFWVMKI